MSRIQARPFIDKVIGSLSDELKTNLSQLINGSTKTPTFRSLITSSNYITDADKNKVLYVTLETWNKTYTGYLIYTNTYCVLISYLNNTQDLSILDINLTTQTYKLVRESLTILELRFSLEEGKESEDVVAIVNQAIEDGEIEVGGNIVAFSNVAFDQDDTATLQVSEEQFEILKGEDNVVVVLELASGDTLVLNRVKYDSDSASFSGFVIHENGEYTSDIYAANFTALGGKVYEIGAFEPNVEIPSGVEPIDLATAKIFGEYFQLTSLQDVQDLIDQAITGAINTGY